jgi:uncharacterized membrane protein HdeD (DUF308 family)
LVFKVFTNFIQTKKGTIMEVISKQSREEATNGEHLNLLSIFYFVFGGLSLLGFLIMLAYTAVFNFILNKVPPGGEDLDTISTIFTSVFGTLALIALANGILQIISGFKLRKRTNRMFSLIVGVLALLGFPFGTALGVFTIIVLSRPGVKEMYQKKQEELDEEMYGMKRY